ncbi:DUF4352 domain-containing protein [Allobranchiibius sp. GilTou73]|uniref:DUF4352 domain-containing protein n=1 Tax=Allobranchiibius sp. GilTou73 TaxID=2904523 RepID=UPI001F492B8C|nr:DUF4352 domain-containing protein [Allobranchiibius sp. GilTou73]UIJ33510.1 DUF4352 domain-containing protein [Allobranchiibius sp. GilTou73]
MSRASSLCLPALITLAATTVAACGTATAPGLETPTVAASGTTSASAAPSGSSSTSGDSTNPSTSSSAPQSSAGAVCKTDSTIGPTYSATMATKPFGTMVQVTDELQRTLQVSPAKPRQITAADPSLLDPGMQYVAVDVRTHLVSGYTLYMSYIDFNLFDAAHRTCYRTSSPSALPEAQQLSGTTLNSTTKDANGAVVFEVPVGTDLSTMTLAFAGGLNDTPQAQWKG